MVETARLRALVIGDECNWREGDLFHFIGLRPRHTTYLWHLRSLPPACRARQKPASVTVTRTARRSYCQPSPGTFVSKKVGESAWLLYCDSPVW
jgi:hypothetical protein